MVFRLAAGNRDYPTAVVYGEQLAAAGTANADDLAVMSRIYYLHVAASAIFVRKTL